MLYKSRTTLFLIRILPMDQSGPSSPSAPKKTIRRRKRVVDYIGVRTRALGKFAAEISVPRMGKRLWLGSYDAADKAARAYDAALYCVRGECGKFNFPGDRRPELPKAPMDSLSEAEIKAIANKFAFSRGTSGLTLVSSSSSSARTPVHADKSDSDLPVSSAAAKKRASEEKGAEAASEDSLDDLEMNDFLTLDLEWVNTL
ncbi:unnamed protein product [Linum tenue]|uniref:AP2/ERF domain-containing protein n=1 Tax=Linum tenue TaxID=586396 RepID=A0AAV0R7E6_9ROSI|nr:unnamed protein product [Linum tenue]